MGGEGSLLPQFAPDLVDDAVCSSFYDTIVNQWKLPRSTTRAEGLTDNLRPKQDNDSNIMVLKQDKGFKVFFSGVWEGYLCGGIPGVGEESWEWRRDGRRVSPGVDDAKEEGEKQGGEN